VQRLHRCWPTLPGSLVIPLAADGVDETCVNVNAVRRYVYLQVAAASTELAHAI
jgi:hypothetical protein